MNKTITYSLQDNFITNLADFAEKNLIKQDTDPGRLAFVFEGKRPGLFLNRALSDKAGKGFFSPSYFSIDEFVRYTLSKKTAFSIIPVMESCYILYSIAKETAPEIIKGREYFSQFLPWAREISKFIDLLDLEDVSSDLLKNIQASASIGYEIPENINILLKNIIPIRELYHKILSEKKTLSKGLTYLMASKHMEEFDFAEFDKILFCGLFYMQKTEQNIIKNLYDKGKAILFFQGDSSRWPVLLKNSSGFSCSIHPALSSSVSNPIGKGGIKSKPEKKHNHSVNLYSAYDRHSQVCTIREILKKIKNPNDTVIVLPDPAGMIPLVSEIGRSAGDFNVSLGYPLKRSSLYHLFQLIFSAQKTRKHAEYYAKDYITALSQPIIKTIKVHSDYRATRILVHKIEEALLGIENTSVSGSIFINLKDIEGDNAIYKLASETIKTMDIKITAGQLETILKELHFYIFRIWENISNFNDFAASIGRFMDLITKKSLIENYPLNLKIAEKIYNIQDQLQNASFSREHFSKEDIFKIFEDMLENEMISFSGSPLKGLQILGVLETRALNFENVIVMDSNESKIPKLRINEPLIPHDITTNLGLDLLEKEEEIQRYLFKRLLSSAKNVHLIYEENTEKEKSRFIEELIWKMQKEKNMLNTAHASSVNFTVKMLPGRKEIRKTAEMTEFLKNLTYSASSINTYTKCPLQFYYKYILGLKEKEELLRDPEAKEIGTFIHNLLEKSFSRFIGRKPKIDQQFRKDFFKLLDNKFESVFAKRMRAEASLLKNIIRYRLEEFLENEKSNEERNVKEILYLEKKFYEKLTLNGNVFKFTYIVDRVDRLEDGSILILDYKTGTDTNKPQRAGLLETMPLKRESIRDRIRSFQLPIYYHFEKKKYKNTPLNTAIYSLRRPKLIYLSSKEKDTERTVSICIKALGFILQEITDPKKPITADPHNEINCKYCPFFYMCR